MNWGLFFHQHDDSIFMSFLLAIILGFFGWIYFFVAPASAKETVRRQAEIQRFYDAHNCKPEGYVATKYEPIRTYRCNGIVYIAEDMK